MAICYDRLFHLMIDKKISNAQLKEKAGFSANIITRLKRNEYVSIESIEKICRVMECGVDDILEFVPAEKRKGAEVFAGTVVKNGNMQIQAQRVGDQTVVSRIVGMVEQSELKKAPIQRYADKFSN